jgi:ATP-dependent protease HslVU (ClpYQ) ATPase subunit
MQVREARGVLEDAEAERLYPQEVVVKEAIRLAEQDG